MLFFLSSILPVVDRHLQHCLDSLSLVMQGYHCLHEAIAAYEVLILCC